MSLHIRDKDRDISFDRRHRAEKRRAPELFLIINRACFHIPSDKDIVTFYKCTCDIDCLTAVRVYIGLGHMTSSLKADGEHLCIISIPRSCSVDS